MAHNDVKLKILRYILKLLFKLVLALIVLVILFAIFYFYNNRLFLIEAKLLWPQKNFSQEAFREGSTTDRAEMVVDLIDKKSFVGTNCRDVAKILGEPTGDYYHTEGNTTYRLTEKESANWILTFLCDLEPGKVEKVFIRKSCCSTSQKILHWLLRI